MRYVLDTHAVIFALVAPKKLGTEARRVLRRIERGQDEGLIPAAVGAEIAMLRELGRTEIGVPELKVALDESPGLRFQSLDLAQVEIFATLQGLRDPFDRLIVSASLAIGARLVTKDSRIRESGLVHVVW
jgi:PIN domain nuclease of toxin-antitoxin system